MSNSLNIVHSIASLALSKGGPSYTVTALASAQQAQMAGTVQILASRLDEGEALMPDARIKVHGVNHAWPMALWHTQALLQRLVISDNTILHDQGIWHPHNFAVCSWALRHHIPYVISTHGMLAPNALTHSALRKRLAAWAYQNRLLRHARCLMATSSAELSNIRAAGLRNPVAVIANGVHTDLPALSRNTTEAHKTMLFLSRIHPIKGLVHAIHAWHRLQPQNWRLRIVGPSENGHREELERLVQDLGLQHSIQFQEAISGTEKYQCLINADAFLLPSQSENFGVAVAEALACGVPVITTTGTPWLELNQRGCGWCIQASTQALVETLPQVFSMSRQQLSEMGAIGRRWMQAEFQWPVIAQRNLHVYEWLLGRGGPPDCVDSPHLLT